VTVGRSVRRYTLLRAGMQCNAAAGSFGHRRSRVTRKPHGSDIRPV
jgi:hypothetical protein